MMGSVAYGVSKETSDVDIYGFCIPPKEMVFPHLAGEIPGFGRQLKRFDQFQAHHVEQHPRQYDITIFSIVKFFQLCMENNPNMLDALFVPRFCILFTTQVGEMVREERELFLHKGSWFKFKGYAYSQLHRMDNKNPEGKRKEIVEKHGYDTKFGYHVVRLLYEAEMILTEGTIDLQRHREHLKAIRRGDVSEEQLRLWASEKEKALERVYEASKLRHKPDEPKLRQLLLDCLESHYGSLSDVVINPDAEKLALRKIGEIVDGIKTLGRS
jgi:predicted nucleotidyltransferase